jgi:hypothetical protein
LITSSVFSDFVTSFPLMTWPNGAFKAAISVGTLPMVMFLFSRLVLRGGWMDGWMEVCKGGGKGMALSLLNEARSLAPLFVSDLNSTSSFAYIYCRICNPACNLIFHFPLRVPTKCSWGAYSVLLFKEKVALSRGKKGSGSMDKRISSSIFKIVGTAAGEGEGMDCGLLLLLLFVCVRIDWSHMPTTARPVRVN